MQYHFQKVKITQNYQKSDFTSSRGLLIYLLGFLSAGYPHLQ